MAMVKNNHDVKEFIPRSFTEIIDNIFNDTLESNNSTKFLPSADISESEKSHEIHISLPGLQKEAIAVEIQEGKLTISGEKKFEQAETRKFHSIENQYGSFKRSFYLPDKINNEAIEAEYINGILKIKIPKDEKKTLKTTIQIK